MQQDRDDDMDIDPAVLQQAAQRLAQYTSEDLVRALPQSRVTDIFRRGYTSIDSAPRLSLLPCAATLDPEPRTHSEIYTHGPIARRVGLVPRQLLAARAGRLDPTRSPPSPRSPPVRSSSSGRADLINRSGA